MGMRVLGPQTMRDIALSPTFLWGTSQPQDGLLGQPSSAAVQGDVGSACAASAAAGNLTCKCRAEVCLGTTLGVAIPHARKFFHK